MTPDSSNIASTKAGLKSRYAYLHLILALLPEPPSPDITRAMTELGTWIDTKQDDKLCERAPALSAILDKMIGHAQKRLPPKKDWRQIADEYWRCCATKEFSFSTGIPYGWLAERFDPVALGCPLDLPYHARVGIGPHARRAAVEEDFLLRDAYFLLVKCNHALNYLESFRGKVADDQAQVQYRTISTANQNVATYGRFALFGFYSFVECLVNSVGENQVLRHPALPEKTKELLRGKKDGRYLSIERKIELFPSLIRPDGQRPIIFGDPQQLTEPYAAFASHVKGVRDASAHYAKAKAEILMSPQIWAKKANEAASVCLAVARGFWAACYPARPGPVYLGSLDEASLVKNAELRVQSEGAQP